MRTPKPWEFQINSTESRAATRAMLDGREQCTRRIEIVTNVKLPHSNSRPEDGEWQKVDDDTLLRTVYDCHADT
jgi:hypothetical protein